MESLVTIRDVAAMASLSERTIHRMIENGEICRPIYFGRAVRFQRSAVERWLKARCAG
jgi:excisionase family DNA binding protein